MGEPETDQQAQDRLIDEGLADRMTGGFDEGDAWTRAFEGAPVPDDSPLTQEEKAGLTALMIRARELNDNEALDKLAELAKDPAEFRRVMNDFQETDTDTE